MGKGRKNRQERRERVRASHPFPSLSSRFFHTFPKQRACSQASVLTISHLKLTESKAMEEKGIDFRSLSPALRNLWLLLVNKYRSDGALINIDKVAGSYTSSLKHPEGV